jgi:AraC family transcriptional regulator of adaptative response / DNA-3-methyladenine glycosylase II
VSGVETITPDAYRRNVTLNGISGSFKVSPAARINALRLQLQLGDHRLLMPAVARIRRMFDLDANPAAIHQALGQDRNLAPLLERFPGIRLTGHWSLYEASVRGIVGQQISTQAARGVLSRLAAAVSPDPDCVTFPDAASIASLGDEHFPMPSRRRETLRALCRLCSDRKQELDLNTLATLKGVGPWTIAMANLRGDGHPDTFPLKDLGLERAWARLPDATISLKTRSAQWRPWGSYAANLLWRSLTL